MLKKYCNSLNTDPLFSPSMLLSTTFFLTKTSGFNVVYCVDKTIYTVWPARIAFAG